ncbi:hypothetical protein EB796_014649 [Bugula neritina]|uniref:Uncharacterized protein n=1 Tax=Bugula neritina TaxID=10212 RepID=A0A7J7JN53_BUGNE|nr:hypothetical protein EB796_014649 [Bugula neritina]
MSAYEHLELFSSLTFKQFMEVETALNFSPTHIYSKILNGSIIFGSPPLSHFGVFFFNHFVLKNTVQALNLFCHSVVLYKAIIKENSFL